MAWEHMDEALKKLGRFGKFQSRILVGLVMVGGFAVAWNMFNHVFIAGTPDYHCKHPELQDNETVDKYLVYGCIEDIGGDELCGYDPCSLKVYDNETGDVNVTGCINGWTYYGPYTSTIVTRWNLVCGEEDKEAIAYSILSVGFVGGGLVFTILSDYLGRKLVCLMCQMGLSVVGIIQAFLPEYYSFVVFQFLRGMFMQGAFLTGVVLISEMFPSNMRIVVGVFAQLAICFGMMILALFAYLIRDYSWLMFTSSVPFIFTFLLYWVVPESVPWLVMQGRYDEAEEILKGAAKENKVTIPTHMLDSMRKSREPGVEDDDDINLCQMFSRSKKMLMYFVVSIVYWLLLPTVYYGITLNSSNLAGDIYLNFFLLAVVELPSALVCILMLPNLGRKKTLFVVHILPLVALVILTLEKIIPHEYDLDILEVVMAMIVKFGVGSAFLISMFYTPEYFPTPVRNSVAGICGTVGTITNIIVPFIINIGAEPGLGYLPYLLFTILVLVSGIMVFFMPETLGKPSPQTVAEVESWEEGICCGDRPTNPRAMRRMGRGASSAGLTMDMEPEKEKASYNFSSAAVGGQLPEPKSSYNKM